MSKNILVGVKITPTRKEKERIKDSNLHQMKQQKGFSDEKMCENNN